MAMRVLWASPLPPVRSGVSDYAMEILPHLANGAEVRVVLPPGVPGDELAARCPSCTFVPTGTRPEEGEIPILHLGNNPLHEWILPMLDQGAPVVVLHDLVLHHLLVEATLGHGHDARYRELLTVAEPGAGPVLARARRHGFSGRLDPFLFPAFDPFVASARAVVVHSLWASRQVHRSHPGLRVQVVAMPAEDPGTVDRTALRERLGLGPEELAVMHVGFLTPAKGLREILAGVAAVRRMGLPVRLVLVGEGGALDSIRAVAAAIGAGDALLATGWVPADLFPALPAAADLGIVLRTPSAGETSAAVVRFLACGTPVAVGGLHQFLEWPAEASPRLTPGPAAAAELGRLLLELHGEAVHGDPGKRRLAARRVYETGGHRPAEVARQFLEALGAVA